MGIGLIGKAAGDQQTNRLTNQSPAVLVCVAVKQSRSRYPTGRRGEAGG